MVDKLVPLRQGGLGLSTAQALPSLSLSRPPSTSGRVAANLATLSTIRQDAEPLPPPAPLCGLAAFLAWEWWPGQRGASPGRCMQPGSREPGPPPHNLRKLGQLPEVALLHRVAPFSAHLATVAAFKFFG